ncbi:hypothetical protein RRG08_060373 [Elysia crispata]|uniref:Uncharacterized protein n=1 Tax=Elysia crispata TaxID=231223 RepID=A0AAE0ZGL4_9GAST|nr:hypothetical protein RRG08_060373 [Elysia crispata]
MFMGQVTSAKGHLVFIGIQCKAEHCNKLLPQLASLVNSAEHYENCGDNFDQPGGVGHSDHWCKTVTVKGEPGLQLSSWDSKDHRSWGSAVSMESEVGLGVSDSFTHLMTKIVASLVCYVRSLSHNTTSRAEPLDTMWAKLNDVSCQIQEFPTLCHLRKTHSLLFSRDVKSLHYLIN